MIDIATLLLTHGLMALALWRLLARDELDHEVSGPPPRKSWQRAGEEEAG